MGSRPWQSILSLEKSPASLAIPWANARFFKFFFFVVVGVVFLFVLFVCLFICFVFPKQASKLVQGMEGLHSSADYLYTALMLSFSLMYIFPKPKYQTLSCAKTFLSTHSATRGSHIQLMTLHLMHSPIWIRILVGIPIDILDTPFQAWENVAEISVAVPFTMACT